ncbi:glycoprotease [uncultured Gemmiger sp.]|uniref:glycoprotease n=1 Tax=uncultured Gemmiger sp. TaxID=1623490 RepID=UPI0025EBCA73|nr:glycoprotease [uncultured Gemmiger sp.]
MLTLGIDTSNYATSLAVFDADAGEVVCDCKKFLPVKAGQLGLRQSDALFHHTAALPELMQKINDTVPLYKIQAVAVSEKPRPVQGSYMPCFLAGVNAATAFSLAGGVPLYKLTHQQGHIAAALYATGDKTLFERETLVFHVSGGTTDLLLCRGAQSIIPLGTSSDLYAGQAVDRLGVKLGFAFPAGVYVSEQAALCEERIKPKVSVRGTACSLSGLENQCAKLLEQGRTAPYVCKYCLLCVAETLLRMAQNALQEHPGLPVVFAGGVMSSDLIRSYITARLPDARFVPAKFASDNAIGIAVLAAKEHGVWQTL